MNDTDLLTYNHSDSYPEWLGEKVCKFVSDMSDEELKKLLSMLKPVNDEKTAAKEDIRLCEELDISDFSVSSGKRTDYYCLLRHTQGNFWFFENLVKNTPACMEGKKLPFIEYNSFIKNSLFCEYAYIINLDDKCLEFWKGFQNEPDETNRYGTDADDGYYPCHMLTSYRFDEIRNSDIKNIVSDMISKKSDDDEKGICW